MERLSVLFDAEVQILYRFSHPSQNVKKINKDYNKDCKIDLGNNKKFTERLNQI